MCLISCVWCLLLLSTPLSPSSPLILIFNLCTWDFDENRFLTKYSGWNRNNSGRKSIDFSRLLSRLIIRSIQFLLVWIYTFIPTGVEYTTFKLFRQIRWICFIIFRTLNQVSMRQCTYNKTKYLQQQHKSYQGRRRRRRITNVETWIIREGLRNIYVCIRAEEIFIIFFPFLFDWRHKDVTLKKNKRKKNVVW